MRNLAVALLVSASVLAFAGCGDDDDDVTIDGSVVVDGSSAIDARPIDARVIDATTPDAEVTAFAGCGGAANPWVDRTGTGDSRSVTIGSDYMPKCMRIKRGQTVTIEASLTHPLRAAVGNPGNEIVSSSTNLTTALNSLGDYGMYCNIHGSPSGVGLAGAIQVVP